MEITVGTVVKLRKRYDCTKTKNRTVNPAQRGRSSEQAENISIICHLIAEIRSTCLKVYFNRLNRLPTQIERLELVFILFRDYAVLFTL